MAVGFSGDSPYHHSYETQGNESISGRFNFTRHSFAGVETNDGKADAFDDVKKNLNVEALQKKAKGWGNVNTHMEGVSGKLEAAYTKLFGSGAWSGDDADKANKTFSDTKDSAGNLAEYSGQMHTGTHTIATAAAEATGVSSGGPSGLAQFANYETGGLAGFNGDGDKAEQAYFTLVDKIGTGRNAMPQQLEWQAKGSASTPTKTQGGDDGGPSNGVGGVTPPGSSGAPQHQSTPTQSIGPVAQVDPNSDPNGPDDNLDHPDNNTQHPDPGHQLTSEPWPHGTDGLDSGSSGGSSGLSGSGVGLDNGSSLAGYDGGSGVGAGAGGGLGAGSASGLSGSGAGLSGSGAGLGGGAGAGAGAGSGVVGAGGSGAGGGRGVGGQVAPMRGGGGGGGDESERERTTWLHEDDDVWGESDAPPSVIS